MTYDQAQGARIGQRTSPENPGVRLCTVSELPEVAYRGQIIYLTDLDVFNVYDGTRPFSAVVRAAARACVRVRTT